MKRWLIGSSRHIGDIIGAGAAVTVAAAVASLLCLFLQIHILLHRKPLETKRGIFIKEAAFSFAIVR